jgi:membrane glycosyltransferase
VGAARLTPQDLGLAARRAVFAALVTGLALGFLWLAVRVLAGGGWTVAEAIILLCLAANAPWLGLSAATGLVGLAVRLLARDPAAAVLPALRDPTLAAAPVTTRTAVALCVRLEGMEGVLPPAGALLAALRARVEGAFVLAVLSDTPAGPAAEREAEAVARLAAGFAPGEVIYRRRAANHGFKAGNLMDFLDSAGAAFDFALVLDADSVMSADAVIRLVRLMQADPRAAILQPTVAGRGADTPFARLFGFGHRHGVRVWATGQAWWQGPQGPYWGHNALLRVAAFRAHARLPVLPGGEAILSHDHVEAALLHGAGWAVRVLPEDAGSAERHPPDLPALFARDLRWAAGNLQYRHLLRRREFGAIGRFQMLQAIAHYALAPLWFAPLPLAALNAATGGGEGTPRGALLALLAAGILALHLPKLAGYAEAWLRTGERPAPRTALRELGLGLLLDPIAALDRSVTVLRLALSRGRAWAPQARDARGLGWWPALRRFGPHAAVGLILAALFAAAGPFALLAALPALAGLLLAVPLAVLTARPEPRQPERQPASARSAAGDRRGTAAALEASWAAGRNGRTPGCGKP